MTRFSAAGVAAAALVLGSAPAWAHPWHRHREPAVAPAAAVDAAPEADAAPASPFLLTAASKPARGVATDIAAAGLPTDWPGFRRYYSQIRKSGFYFSEGELEADLAAIAVPLQQADGAVIGALSLVTTVQRMAVIDRAKLTPLIQRAAREISARLH